MALAEVVDFLEYRQDTTPRAIGEVAPVVFEADFMVNMDLLVAENRPLTQPLSNLPGCVRISVRDDDTYTTRFASGKDGLTVVIGGLDGGSRLLDALRYLMRRE